MANANPYLVLMDAPEQVEAQRLAEEDRLRAYYSAATAPAAVTSTAPAVAEPAASFAGPPAPPAPPQTGAFPAMTPEQEAQVSAHFAGAGGVFRGNTPAAPAAPSHVAPPIPTGPTQTEDAAFEAFKAKNAVRQPVSFVREHPRSAGGGGPSNSDPYGVNASTARLLGSYDQQAEATGRVGQLEANKAYGIGAHREEMARRMAEDAAIARAEEQHAADLASQQIDELQRQLDDVRARKIQPLSVMEASGLGGLALVASALAGFGQGLTHGKENAFLAQVNRVIDQQVAADEKNLDNERAGLQAKTSLLQQQRQIHRDLQTAKDAARNLYYEAFKEEIAGEAAKYDSPIYNANASRAIADISQAQAVLQKQLAEKKRAEAAAGAAQAMAQAKEVRDLRNSVYDKVLTQAIAAGEPIERASAIAENEANRQIGAVYSPGSVPQRGVPEADHSEGGGLDKAGRAKVALERHQAQGELNAHVAAIEAAKRDVDKIVAGGVIGNYWSAAPAWASEGSRKEAQVRDMWNTQVKISIGAAYKLGTDAMEPKNLKLIEEFAHPYEILPSDNRETALQKMSGLQQFLTQNAASKGASGTSGPSAATRLDLKPVR